jgi:hypothetical protein
LPNHLTSYLTAPAKHRWSCRVLGVERPVVAFESAVARLMPIKGCSYLEQARSMTSNSDT